MSAVFVVTTNDQRTNQTETAGAFTDLQEARQCTVEIIDVVMDGNIRGFVEEWDGGTFVAHHELRWRHRHEHTDGTTTEAGWEWWVAREPSFAPTRETTDTTTKEN